VVYVLTRSRWVSGVLGVMCIAAGALAIMAGRMALVGLVCAGVPGASQQLSQEAKGCPVHPRGRPWRRGVLSGRTPRAAVGTANGWAAADLRRVETICRTVRSTCEVASWETGDRFAAIHVAPRRGVTGRVQEEGCDFCVAQGRRRVRSVLCWARCANERSEAYHHSM
jgi:hypothetical protein